MSSFARQARKGTVFSVRVTPGAKRSAITGLYGEGAVRISIAAPPANGKANAELRSYIAKILGIRRSGAPLIWGASSRDKRILVSGADADDVRERLMTLLRS